ncbi:MAG: phosphonate dehydrogenase [Terriglobales bacterium]
MVQRTHDVVITNWVHDEVIRRLSGHFNVVANRARKPWPRSLWLANVSKADALMLFMPDRISEDVLRRCPRLRIIAAVLKGYDNIDIEACARRGITVTHSEQSLTEAVAELTVGLMISLARSIVAGDRIVRAGRFRGWRPWLYGGSLSGSTAGFLGMGEIGRATAARLRGFGCSLIYYDEQHLSTDLEENLDVRRVELNDLIGQSDFLILALPLAASTLHLVGPEFLAQMKCGAYLINPARGSLVDEVAVARALRTGRLGGYAADVFEFEDWARKDRPRTIPRELLEAEHTVLTPHIGSAVDRVRCAVAMEAAENIVNFYADGKMRGVITRPDGWEMGRC